MLKNNSQNCQKVISAKVYSCDNKNNVTLLIDAGCESCTSSCIMSTASKKITLYTEKKYNTGDTVSIIMFAVSAIIDTVFHKDTLTAFSAVLSLVISWLILKYISKNINKSPVRIIN